MKNNLLLISFLLVINSTPTHPAGALFSAIGFGVDLISTGLSVAQMVDNCGIYFRDKCDLLRDIRDREETIEQLQKHFNSLVNEINHYNNTIKNCLTKATMLQSQLEMMAMTIVRGIEVKTRLKELYIDQTQYSSGYGNHTFSSNIGSVALALGGFVGMNIFDFVLDLGVEAGKHKYRNWKIYDLNVKIQILEDSIRKLESKKHQNLGENIDSQLSVANKKLKSLQDEREKHKGNYEKRESNLIKLEIEKIKKLDIEIEELKEYMEKNQGRSDEKNQIKKKGETVDLKIKKKNRHMENLQQNYDPRLIENVKKEYFHDDLKIQTMIETKSDFQRKSKRIPPWDIRVIKNKLRESIKNPLKPPGIVGGVTFGLGVAVGIGSIVMGVVQEKNAREKLLEIRESLDRTIKGFRTDSIPKANKQRNALIQDIELVIQSGFHSMVAALGDATNISTLIFPELRNVTLEPEQIFIVESMKCHGQPMSPCSRHVWDILDHVSKTNFTADLIEVVFTTIQYLVNDYKEKLSISYSMQKLLHHVSIQMQSNLPFDHMIKSIESKCQTDELVFQGADNSLTHECPSYEPTDMACMVAYIKQQALYEEHPDSSWYRCFDLAPYEVLRPPQTTCPDAPEINGEPVSDYTLGILRGYLMGRETYRIRDIKRILKANDVRLGKKQFRCALKMVTEDMNIPKTKRSG